jgi:hypothetical protein
MKDRMLITISLAMKGKTQVLIPHLKETVIASEKFLNELNGGFDARNMFF